jgi:putative FmdB family regulatory protein
MPLYEYECDACGHRFETIQRFSDPPLDRCPKCGSAVRKLQSAPAFHLKGSGWYVTDYARKDADAKSGDTGGEKPGDKPGDKPAEQAAGPSGGSKAEAKPTAASSTAAPAPGVKSDAKPT